MKLHDAAAMAANDKVRVNVQELMEMRRLKQVEFAERLGKSQPWLSKRMTGQTPFQMEDLDVLAEAFGLTPAQLLQDGYGKLYRRCGDDRREGKDRRRMGERFGVSHGDEHTPARDRRQPSGRRPDDKERPTH